MGDLFGAITGTDILSGSGLLLIVVLLVTGRLITIAQHRRELATQKAYYEGRLADRDARYADMKDARDAEHERGDKLEAQFASLIDVLETNTHVIAAIDQAAKDATP